MVRKKEGRVIHPITFALLGNKLVTFLRLLRFQNLPFCTFSKSVILLHFRRNRHFYVEHGASCGASFSPGQQETQTFTSFQLPSMKQNLDLSTNFQDI